MQDALYQARILDHFKHPRNKGALTNADVTEKGSNQSCGDTLTVHLKFDDELINAVSFEGEGCAISQAAASLLTEKLKGMQKHAARKLSEQDVYDLLGVPITTGRKKCALLAWSALQNALV